jgi:glycosyltransferase involved in cell wall biosynthesis
MRNKKLVIALPVYNEEKIVARHVRQLEDFLSKKLSQFDWKIIIINNGSTDQTLTKVQCLAQQSQKITVLNLTEAGRGGAIRYAWEHIVADYYVYMDIDFSTPLNHLPNLLHALEQKRFDIACGNRLLPASHVRNRTVLREFMSRTYSWMVRTLLQVGFSDPQCGFKAVNRRVTSQILPLTHNQNWFFDTELLTIAEKKGYAIYEEPVVWEDDHSSSVKKIPTILEDLSGIVRLIITKPWRHL